MGGGRGQNSSWSSFIRYDEKQDRPQVNRALLKRIWGYARPYFGRITLMILSILAGTLLGLLPPLLYRDLIDNALTQRDWGRLNLLALGMIAIPVLRGLISVGDRWLSVRVGEGIIYDLRRALFEHLQGMSLRFFTNTRTGELMSRLNNDVVGSQQALTSTLMSIISSLVAVVLTLAIMLSLEWRLTLIATLVLPLFILPARRVAIILRRLTRESLDYNAEMNALMNETLNVSGALLVKLFGRAPDENARFGDRAMRVRDIGVRSAVIGRWFMMGLGLASAVGLALVFWLGGQLVLSGVFTIGTLVAFGFYVQQLYGPLAALTNARVEMATSLVSFERVFEVLDLSAEIVDRPGAQTLEHVEGEVRFEHVTFAYSQAPGTTPAGLPDVRRTRGADRASFPVPMSWLPRANGSANGTPTNGTPANGTPTNGVPANGAPVGAEPPAESTEAEGPRLALDDVSFQVLPGQLAALVGPSGAGKTTITYLLPRLYDPQQGRVLLDGHDLRDLTLDTLSAQIGMVTQETYLFHDTIRHNLLYARPNATQDEMEEACRLANIHDFVAGLPDKYDTVVGERGYRLSGGEKQRIAIARVILKNPRLLVLDEATSHLDSHSEALIQTALTRVMRGRTTVAIAHRLSTILAADLILVMDQGRLVEQGTHAELLARDGLYASLYNTQFRFQIDQPSESPV